MPAGYSGTPLPKKLGIKDGSVLAVLGAPDGFVDAELVPMPDRVTVRTTARGPLDVCLFFTVSRAELARRLPALGKAVFPGGAVWVSWPKKASKVPTDITEDVVREVCLPLGLVDTKVAAVNDIWSGLKLMWRKERRT